MKTAWFAVPAVALLAVACTESTAPIATRATPASIGTISASAENGNGVLHRVSVGGADVDLAAHTDANFSLVAIQYGDGSAQGE